MNRTTYVALPDRPGATPEVTVTNGGKVVVFGGRLVEDEKVSSKTQAVVVALVAAVHEAHPGALDACDLGCLESLTVVGLNPEDLGRLL